MRGWLRGLVFASLIGSVASAQVGSIAGKVVDSTGAPVAGAVLTVDRTNIGAQTASSGTYLLRGVPVGPHTLRVRVLGFAPASAEITVRANESVSHDFTVARSAIALAAVTVVTGSRAHHNAADELAVPVDVIPAEVIAKQGTNE